MKLTVIGENLKTAECTRGQSVLDALTKSGIYISAVCGGQGRCGKCKIRLIQGSCEPSPEDKRFFTEEELAEGFRLACTAYPAEDCTLRVLGANEEEFDVLTDIAEELPPVGEAADADILDETADIRDQTEEQYLIAVDVGTTTLALSLILLSPAEENDGRTDGKTGGKTDGYVVDTYTGINHQRAYGADVISRIRAYDEGKGQAMTASVRQDLLTGMETILKRTSVDRSRVRKVMIAGNTTMGHLLLGYDCHGLGQVPFTPVNLEPVTMPFEELFESDLLQAPVTVLPGFSAFVGGDIVSGLYCCKFYEAEKPSLFVDLGTNGEMAVGNKHRLLVTSTAAGPAFEGGNISQGMGSVAGAICGVEIRDGRAQVETVGDRPPVGICGTGVIEAAAALLQEELLDESGLLDEAYFEDGFVLAKKPDGQEITLTQKDIRELQLAKAAVRGGLETLLLRYGVTCRDLEHVYVAGGFGVHLNMEKAVAIGLFPAEILEKIRAVGNTSLAGAALYGQDPEAEEICREMIRRSHEVDLSTDREFQERYMDSMFFLEE